MNRSATILVLTALAAFVCGLATAADASNGPWPKFYGQVGPDAAQTPDELRDMAAAGFHFGLFRDSVERSPAADETHMLFIDGEPEFEMDTACRPELRATQACSGGTQQRALARIRQYVTSPRNSDRENMIGYWILDDDPGGDIRPLLRSIHDIIAEQNIHSPFARPTICSFGAPKSLKNFSPQACDMVAIYLYSRKPVAGQAIDWSLSSRLSEMLAGLKARGWDQAREPLIGMPQAFGNYTGQNYALPTADELVEQATAYCKAGAVALLPYSWHDGFALPGSQLYNTPTLVSALQKAIRICRSRYWH